MPQSLHVSTPPQGNSSKRQRSADSRDPQPRLASAGQNGTNRPSLRPSSSQLRSNVRMPAYLEKSRSEILATFQELEWKQRFRLFHAMENPDSSPYKVDRSEIVISRNRYGNVQPWDASRVKLKMPICGSDYVNASPIVLKSQSSELPGGSNAAPTKEVKYIASQGPKHGQKSHFWHMVHQETPGETGVVIMLTQLTEENKEKCAQYYPLDYDDPTMALQHEENKPRTGEAGLVDDGSDPFLDSKNGSGADNSEGSIPDNSSTPTEPAEPDPSTSDSITLLSKEVDNSVGCEIRKLRLIINDQPKTIIHYLFSKWPDFGKPEAADRAALIELSRRSYEEAGDSPRVVHCSAGVGRTGTWIALDFLIREVEEGRLLDNVKSSPNSHNQQTSDSTHASSQSETWGRSGPLKVNTPTQEDGFDKDEHDLIYETVNTLRDQRMMMVVREVQFSFLYEVVKEAVLARYRVGPEGATVTDGVEADTQPPPIKARRVSEEGSADETVSEAETEIIGLDKQQKEANSDDDDPYSAVSPDFVRRGMSQDFR